MNCRILFWLILLMLISLRYINAQHINEFHYDDMGGDEGEFVEVVIPNPQPSDLSEYKIVLYNGNGDIEYFRWSLDDPLTQIVCTSGLCYYVWNGGTNSIENGSPGGDGIAFVRVTATDTTIFDFISYEGTLTAVDGPAIGVTSTNIGISESGSTPAGYSLQKVPGGTTWFAGPETKGHVNPIELLSFEGIYEEDLEVVILKWITASELNNHYFELQRSIDQRTFVAIAKIPGAGNSQEVIQYEYRDQDRLSGKVYYRLKQVDYGNSFSYSPLISVESTEQLALEDMKPIYYMGALHFRESNYRPGVNVSLYNAVGQLLFHRKNIHSGEMVPVNLSGSGIVFFYLQSQGQERSGRLLTLSR